MMDEKLLAREALAARESAYAPYSDFLVGAALIDADGKIWRGCNIENAAYSVANCAERTALFKAVSEGARKFCALAVAGGPRGAKTLDYCYPCGVCRQALAEFCTADMPVLLVKSEEDYQVDTLGGLLPHSFGAADMKK